MLSEKAASTPDNSVKPNVIKNDSTNNTYYNIHLSDRESNKRGRTENVVLLYHLSFKNQNI